MNRNRSIPRDFFRRQWWVGSNECWSTEGGF